jgi:hypothetical protein
MNLSFLFRYYAVLLVLLTAYTFVEREDVLDTGNVDLTIPHLSIDNGEFNDDQPTDALTSSVSLYQNNKYQSVRTFEKKVPFFTSTHSANNPRAPPFYNLLS